MGAVLCCQIGFEKLGKAREKEVMAQSKERGVRFNCVWKTGPMLLTRLHTFLHSWDWTMERCGTEGISVNILDGN